MTATDDQPRALPGETFVDELEQLRLTILQGKLLRRPTRPTTQTEAAEGQRRSHRGGANVVKRNSERYLNCPVKAVRRRQLRKLVDEAGEDSFPGASSQATSAWTAWCPRPSA